MIGITQFHLPEADEAQVFDGVISLSYFDKEVMDEVVHKLCNPSDLLRDSEFKKIKHGKRNKNAIIKP